MPGLYDFLFAPNASSGANSMFQNTVPTNNLAILGSLFQDLGSNLAHKQPTALAGLMNAQAQQQKDQLSQTQQKIDLKSTLGNVNFFRQKQGLKPYGSLDEYLSDSGQIDNKPSTVPDAGLPAVSQQPQATPTAMDTTPSPMALPQPTGGIMGNAPIDAADISKIESNNNPNAVSPKGALGAMQVMPTTLQDPGFGVSPAQNNTPDEQARVGKDYFSAMLKKYPNQTLSSMAYNWGPGNVDKWLSGGADPNKVPAETVAYVGRLAISGAQNNQQPQEQIPQPQPTQQAPQSQPIQTAQNSPDMNMIYQLGVANPELGMKLLMGQHRLLTPEEKKSEGFQPDDIVSTDMSGNRDVVKRSGVKSQAEIDQDLQVTKANREAQQGALVDAIGGPEAMAALAKPIAEYRSPMNTTGRSAVLNNLIMQEVLKQNPDYRAQNFTSSNKAQQAFATGKQGDTVRSLNVSISHLETLRELGDALKNGDISLINKARQAWAEQFGEAAPTNFDTAKAIVADEVAKGVIGGTTAQNDRETLAASLRRERSPQAIEGSINTFQHLLAGQLDGLKNQYERTTFLKDFDESLLTPQARDVFSRMAKAAGKSSTPDANTKPIQLPANAIMQLKDGQITTFGNGTKWTLKGGKPVQVQ